LHQQEQLTYIEMPCPEALSWPQLACAIWLELIREVPLLPVESAIAEIGEVYMRHRLMSGTCISFCGIRTEVK
jgi:hypothetical protein